MKITKGISVVLDLEEDGKHVGIYYREGNASSYIHLANHYDLKKDCSPPSDRFDYIVHRSNEVPGRAKMLYGLIAKVADSNFSGIPYSVPYNENQGFIEDGQWSCKNPGDGLTCATFVLKAFAYAGINLLDATGWPQPSAEDVQYAEDVIDHFNKAATYLKSKGMDDKADAYSAHATAMRKNISGNWIRIRPTHVCASAKIFSGSPPKHPEIFVEAKNIELETLGFIQKRDVSDNRGQTMVSAK